MSEELNQPKPTKLFFNWDAFAWQSYGGDLYTPDSYEKKELEVYTAAQVHEMLASLRSELEAARGKVEALTKPQEPVAYAIFAENGNIRLWSTEPQHVKRIAQEKGLQLVKLYTHP